MSLRNLKNGDLVTTVNELVRDVQLLKDENDVITTSTQVFVTQDGNDTDGDGSRAAPYATVARALLDYHGIGAPGVAFRVEVVAPYTGPGFSYEHTEATVENTSAATELQPPVVSVGAYYEAALAGVDDPRFVTEVGPITASAVSIINTMYVAYTVPTGSFPASSIGKFMRVFRNGSEVGRATIASIVTGGTDTVYLSNSRTSGPTTVWSPAIGDILYAVENAVVFNSPVRICGSERTTFVLTCCKIQVLGSAFANDYSLNLLRGLTYMSNVRLVNTSVVRDEALYIRAGADVYCAYVPSTITPWMDATERTFIWMSAGFITHSSASTDAPAIIRGECHLRGWVFDCKTAVLTGGLLVTQGMWFRGQVFIGVGSTLCPEAPCMFGGNRVTPYPQSPIFVDGANVGNEHGHAVAIMVDTAGYAAALPICSVKRSRFTTPITFNGIGGAVTITAPVFKVDDFSQALVGTGNITNSTPGQDLQAGSTYAAFAGVPITDAATLTRIAAS